MSIVEEERGLSKVVADSSCDHAEEGETIFPNLLALTKTRENIFAMIGGARRHVSFCKELV